MLDFYAKMFTTPSKKDHIHARKRMRKPYSRWKQSFSSTFLFLAMLGTMIAQPTLTSRTFNPDNGDAANGGTFSSDLDLFGIFNGTTTTASQVIDENDGTDALGIIVVGSNDNRIIFSDLVNGDNNSGTGTLTWVIDISAAGTLQEIKVDAAAMGDFESSNDDFGFTWSIDGSNPTDFFSGFVDEAASLMYTLAAGNTNTLNDPFKVFPDPVDTATVTLNNVFQTLTYTGINGQSGTTLTITLTGGGDGGSEVFGFDNLTIVGSNGTLALTSDPINATCSGPTITVQPRDSSADVGGRADYSVVASGVGTLSYQWQLKALQDTGFTNIAETTPFLSVSSAEAGDNGNQYRVIISDDNGTPNDNSDDCEVTSDAATLNVRLPIAITEFMSNSIGGDREFVELRNYGTSSVDLAGWTLSDEDANDVTLPSYTLAPDGVLLVVLATPSESAADAKADFERDWFLGVAQANIIVINNSSFLLANSTDEIILKDGNGNVSWSLAYGDDETEGRATFLTSTDYLNIPNVYGSKASPGVNRNGNDLGQTNFLGYESNNNTTDPDAVTSTDGNVGSPEGEAEARTAQVAITEFLDNSVGNDREFVELRNYGTSSVDLAGWTLSDEDANDVTLPSYTLAPDGVVLIVLATPSESAADAKADFERDWFGGVAQSNIIVINNSSFILGNSTDEIILKDGSGNVSWSLAYTSDGTEGHATFLTSTDYLNIPNVYGSKASPGINRNGNDLGQTNFLGYESNNNTTDPDAVTSTDGNVGSPEGEAEARTAQVAITEFLDNSVGNDREFVELRNYGSSPVNLAGWTLSDEDANDVTLPSYTLAPDGVVLIVLATPSESAADAKADFERDWFGGMAQSNIIIINNSSFILGNSTDEIILKDGSGNVSWSLAYTSDGTEGHATFLTSTDYLNIPNVYGSKAFPGINRDGNDLGQTNFLGYESNNNTTDPDAVTSADGNVGSPEGQVAVITCTGPTITLQPRDSSASVGGRADFAVVASGVGTLSYQWQLKALQDTGFTNIAETTPFLSVSSVEVTDDGNQYRVIISDDNGTPNDNSDDCQVTSDAATLTVTGGADTEDPVAVCQDITVWLDASGKARITAADVDGGSTDNVGITSMFVDPDTFDCNDVFIDNSPSDLFFSEYIEGSGFNKALEIFNGTGSSVDLSAYSVQIFFNGNSSAGATIPLSGTLADGDVFVIADDGADAAITAEADLTPTNSFFNGDDAIALIKDGVIIDVFGQIGTDPGSSWPGGGANVTLRRKASISAGDTNGADAFNASTEWDSFANNTFGGLGSHSINAGGSPTVPVSLSVFDAAGNFASCTANITVRDTTSPAVVTQNISVFLDGAGQASIVPADLDGGTTDNCSIASLEVDKTDFSCSDVGTGTPTELFFSEYLEGTGNNKAIEIFNGTGAPVDLSTYLVVFSFNGGPGKATTSLGNQGMLADGEVFVIADDAANGAIKAQADILSPTSFFNGDDAVILINGTDTVDVFGQVGVDPGSSWPGGGANVTLRRKSNIFSGDPIGADAFDASLEWDTFAVNDSSGLGSHTFIPEAFTTPVTFTATDASGNTSSQQVLVTVLDTAGICTQPTIAIHTIQGAGHTSPFFGQEVKVDGIVTGVANNGFYLQEPDADTDNDVATSEGIFVFTNSAPAVAKGYGVEVRGNVAEFIPGGSGTGNLGITEIVSPTITVLDTGNILPTPIIIGSSGRTPPTEVIADDNFTDFDPATEGIDFYESLEGMLVTVEDAKSVGPRDAFNDFTSFEFFVVANQGVGATGINSNMGITINDPDTTDGTVIGDIDFNPEKIRIDALTDRSLLPAINTGTLFGDITGVVSYGFGNFEVLIDAPLTPTISDTLKPEVSTLMGSANELTIATYNVLNLDLEDVDGDTDVSDGRFDQIASQIINNLNTPDIIGLQEVQDNNGSLSSISPAADSTLKTLVEAIVAAGGPTYSFIDNTFITNNLSGGQPGGNIRVAFLYNPNRVDLVNGSVQPIGDQLSGSPFEGARLPLVATFDFQGEEVTVVNNHFSSRGGSDPLFGAIQPMPFIGGERDRELQAQEVRNFVNTFLGTNPDSNLVVLGDFNGFPFENFQANILGGGNAEPPLNSLLSRVGQLEAYTFIFQGNSQALDNILVSDNLNALTPDVDIVHVNVDFADTPQRASDHDPIIASFQFNLDNTAPVITLLESTIPGTTDAFPPRDTLFWPRGFPYQDPGATASDDTDGNLTDNIQVDASAVNVDSLGEYIVVYTVQDAAGNPATAERLVIVVDKPIVTGFVLVDADADTSVTPIMEGDLLLLEDLPENFNIFAEIGGTAEVNRVFLDLNGPVANERTERVDPYAVFGDSRGNFSGRPTMAGMFDITAVPYSMNGRLMQGFPLTVNFEIIDCAISGPIADAGDDTSLDCNSGDAMLTSNFTGGIGEVSRSWSGPNNFSDTSQTTTVTVAGLYTLTVTDLMTGCTSTDEVLVEPCQTACDPQVIRFVLVDAKSDTDIRELADNAVIDLTKDGRDLSIIAEVFCEDKVESVKLELTGAQVRTRTENKAPYALSGDINGDYRDQEFIPGSYTIKATPFTERNAQGNAGIELMINFTVINGNPAQQTQLGDPSLNPDYELTVYPVPTDKELFIDMKFFDEGVYEAELFDVAGRAIMSQKMVYDEVTGKRFSLNTERLAAGVYMLRVSGQTYQEWRKISVRR